VSNDRYAAAAEELEERDNVANDCFRTVAVHAKRRRAASVPAEVRRDAEVASFADSADLLQPAEAEVRKAVEEEDRHARSTLSTLQKVDPHTR
jgi:hypothetical protein